MWWSCELAENRLHLDLSRSDRPVIVQRMLQVPYDLRPEVVALAGRRPPKHVDDPLRNVLARIGNAEQRVNVNGYGRLTSEEWRQKYGDKSGRIDLGRLWGPEEPPVQAGVLVGSSRVTSVGMAAVMPGRFVTGQVA